MPQSKVKTTYIHSTCDTAIRLCNNKIYKYIASLKLVEDIYQGTPTDEISFEPFAHQRTKRNELIWGHKSIVGEYGPAQLR